MISLPDFMISYHKHRIRRLNKLINKALKAKDATHLAKDCEGYCVALVHQLQDIKAKHAKAVIWWEVYK